MASLFSYLSVLSYFIKAASGMWLPEAKAVCLFSDAWKINIVYVISGLNVT